MRWPMTLPLNRWRPDWRQPGVVRADLLAGLTGAIVVLPQGLAFATLAGLPPQHGLYAAMLPCLIAALFGSSRLMVTGPANAIALSTLALVAPLAAVGTPRYVELVLTLAFLVGVVQILLGLARAGTWAERVPHAVIVGFTCGAAVLIASSQLGTLLGLDLPRGQRPLAAWQAAWAQRGSVVPAAVAVAGVTWATLWAARPLARWVPPMLLAIVAGSLTALALARWAPGLGPLKTLPALPGAIPPLTLPDLSLDTLRLLFSATLVMTLLKVAEATAIAQAMARQRGDAFDANQEFVGQGLANLAASATGGMPASGSFNRSAVNARAGARTPLAAASAAVFLFLIVLGVSPLAPYLPLTVVSALLVAVALGLFDLRELKRLWQEGWAQRVPLFVTFVGTVAISLEWALLGGILSALLVRRFRPGAP